MNSTTKNARLAGLIYLLLAIPAPFALIYVPSVLYVRGDAAATFANITSNEMLFRLGIAAGLAYEIVFLYLAGAFYRLFKETDRMKSMMLVLLVVVSVAAGFLNRLNQVAVLIVTSGADFLNSFTGPQLETIAFFFVRLHSQGIQTIALFWGLWLIPLGLLCWKSKFIPKIFGVLLILNGLAYIADAVVFILFPDALSALGRLTWPLKLAGELPFMLWLIIKGTRSGSSTEKTLVPAAAMIPLLFLIPLFGAADAAANTEGIGEARAALNRGENDRAISLLEKAVAAAPKSAEAHFYLARAYGAKAQNGGMLAATRFGPKVRDFCERAVALDPRYTDARFCLIDFYSMAPGVMGGSQQKALDQAKAVKTIDPILGHRAYGIIYTRQEKNDLARKEYVEAIRLHPGSAKAHTFFGQFLVNVEKNYGAAFTEYETALKLDATYMPTLYHLGRAAALSGSNLPRGEDTLRKYLSHTPAENEPSLASAHYQLGLICEKTGRKEAAKQSFQTAVRLSPSLKPASEALKRMR
jgi:Tfp pilus assembly protein PilF